MTSPNHEIEPASDDELVEMIAGVRSVEFLPLIARIRAEQASQATAREQAIRECIATIEAMNEINEKRVCKALTNLLQTGEETK